MLDNQTTTIVVHFGEVIILVFLKLYFLIDDFYLRFKMALFFASNKIVGKTLEFEI